MGLRTVRLSALLVQKAFFFFLVKCPNSVFFCQFFQNFQDIIYLLILVQAHIGYANQCLSLGHRRINCRQGKYSMIKQFPGKTEGLHLFAYNDWHDMSGMGIHS